MSGRCLLVMVVCLVLDHCRSLSNVHIATPPENVRLPLATIEPFVSAVSGSVVLCTWTKLTSPPRPPCLRIYTVNSACWKKTTGYALIEDKEVRGSAPPRATRSSRMPLEQRLANDSFHHPPPKSSSVCTRCSSLSFRSDFYLRLLNHQNDSTMKWGPPSYQEDIRKFSVTPGGAHAPSC